MNYSEQIFKILGIEPKEYKAGTEVTISAHGFAIYPKGELQNLNSEEFEIKGHDATAIAERVLKYMRSMLPFDEMMNDYDIRKSDILEAIEEAFYDIF